MLEDLSDLVELPGERDILIGCFMTIPYRIQKVHILTLRCLYNAIHCFLLGVNKCFQSINYQLPN